MKRLLQYLTLVLKWRKLILINTAAMVAVAVVVSLVVPHRYSATAALLPPPEDDIFGISSALGVGIGSSLSRLQGGLLGASTPSDLMVRILESRTVLDAVVDRCSIMEHYRIKSHLREEARKALTRMTDLGASDEGVVSISVDAKTPQLAADIANCYVEELDHFLRTSNMSRGRNMRKFIEHRLGEVDSSVSVARDSMEVFQQRHRTLAIDEEAVAAIDVYAELKSQLLLREAELEMLAQVADPQNPTRIRLRREVDAFRDQLRGLERGRAGDGFGAGFAVPFEELPAVASEYLRRYQELKIQEEAYVLLYQQYEYAKIMEARDTPTLTILDDAVPPQRRSFPRRTLFAAIGLLFGLASGCAFAFVAEYFQRLSATRPAEYNGWRELVRLVRGDVRSFTRLFTRKKH